MRQPRRPVSFIATDAPEDAKVFYRDVLGLTLKQDTPYALVFDDAGQTLRAQIVPDFQPVGYTVHGWEVCNIADEIETLAAKGVTCEHFHQLSQTASGVWTTPDGNKIAWFKDPSGNLPSLTEFLFSDQILNEF